MNDSTRVHRRRRRRRTRNVSTRIVLAEHRSRGAALAARLKRSKNVIPITNNHAVSTKF
jgi:hypothetical protein